MARRRDRDLHIDLNLDGGEPDDSEAVREPSGVATGPTGGPGDVRAGWFTTRLARPIQGRWRGLPRRLRVGFASGTAAVVAVVVAGVAVVDARVDAARAEHMAALPGGLTDLSEPVRETWRFEGDFLAVLPDGIVALRDGTDVIGIEAADGTVAWRHELGPALDCGPRTWRPGDEHLPVERITCVYGAGVRTAAVVEGGGAPPRERRLGLADRPYSRGTDGTSEIGPAADGAVYVLDSVDTMLEVDPQDAADRLEHLRDEGTWEDPVLRLEDAVTGEVRGEVSIVLRTAEELGRCPAETGPDGEARRFVVDAWPSTAATQLAVCDGAATRTLAADGTTLDAVVLRSIDGVSYRFTDRETQVLAEDGGVGVTLPGFVIEPWAVDSSGGPWLVAGEELAAHDQAGEQLWVSEVRAGSAFARAGGVAVVGGVLEPGLTAVDLASGEVRWTGDELSESVGHGAVGAGGAATDGEAVLLAFQSAAATDLVAIDLDDGSELWRTGHDGLVGRILAVDGHLLMLSKVDGGGDPGDVLVGLGPTS